MKRRGRIVEIKKEVETFSEITQGIKRHEQGAYEAAGYVGGNGTYFNNFESVHYINVVIFLYDCEDKSTGKFYEQRTTVLDIRDMVLLLNGKQCVSKKLFEYIRTNNVGRKVWVDFNPVTGEMTLPSSELDLVQSDTKSQKVETSKILDALKEINSRYNYTPSSAKDVLESYKNVPYYGEPQNVIKKI